MRRTYGNGIRVSVRINLISSWICDSTGACVGAIGTFIQGHLPIAIASSNDCDAGKKTGATLDFSIG